MRKRPLSLEQPPTPRGANSSSGVKGLLGGYVKATEASEDSSDDDDDDGLLAELVNEVETVPAGGASQLTSPRECRYHLFRHGEGSRSASAESDAHLAAMLARENADAMLERLAQQEEEAERAAERSGAANGRTARPLVSPPSSHHQTGGNRRTSSFARGPHRAYHHPTSDGSDTSQQLDDALLVHLLGFVGHRNEVGPAIVCVRWQRCKVNCDRERAVLSFELSTRLGASLARELEVELFAACGAAVGKHYWQRARSLVFNLRDRTPKIASSTSPSLVLSSSSSSSSSSRTAQGSETVPWWAEGGWACSLCTLENSADVERCQACDGLRGIGLISQQRAFSAPHADVASFNPSGATDNTREVASITPASSSDITSVSEAPIAPLPDLSSSHTAAEQPNASLFSTEPTVAMNSLCARVLNGSLSPRALANMTAAQLATPELAARRDRWEKQGNNFASQFFVCISF